MGVGWGKEYRESQSLGGAVPELLPLRGLGQDVHPVVSPIGPKPRDEGSGGSGPHNAVTPFSISHPYTHASILLSIGVAWQKKR